MFRFISIITCLFIVLHSTAQQTPVDPYNIVWTTQSKNAAESMPCGGGDIGLNVWVEKNELLIYIARSGSFDENNALLKSGRIRVKLSPNLLEQGSFRQELHLKEGYITVSGKSGTQTWVMHIWADVFHPVVHVGISSSKKISVESTYESWRYEDHIMTSRENFGNSWKWAAPKGNITKKDSIAFRGDEILFWHHNQQPTIFDATVAQQGMDTVKDQLYNPLQNLTFGGCFSGKGFIPAGTTKGVYVNTAYKGWKLRTKNVAQAHELTLQLYTAQEHDVQRWLQSLDAVKAVTGTRARKAFPETTDWWKQYWERSFIQIDATKAAGAAWELGRNYQLFRYMLGCNAKGVWPTKFNGGLLTVDPALTDTAHKATPDYRNWGGGLHTAQNQRLVYFPMIKSGDWDVLQPQLDFYMRILHNAELRTKVYWGHAGASFTEQTENYGLPDYAEYGQKRPAGYDKGMEYNAWLEYLWDTVFEFCLMILEEERYTGKDIGPYIPFIESCLRFYDEHYQYLAKQRGSKALDGNGKLVLYPGSAAETFKMATNSTTTVAALTVITQRLLALPVKYGTAEQRAYWTALLQRIPSLSYTSFNGHTTIAPAKSWERVNNTESPQLYPVYPWGIFGIGKPGLDTALNTWRYDTLVQKFRSPVGWKQDNIFAARLGLTEEAWKLTSLKLQNSGRRFPAFWGPGFDWVPDHNWGGSGMMGLQEMLLQVDDQKILLFPAWPKDIDVHFKLHAPHNTTVEAELKHGKVVSLIVLPESRRKDIVSMVQ